jgi:hypothetical protein
MCMPYNAFMRFLFVLLLVACGGTAPKPPPVEPTPDPVPTDLIALETNPKPAAFVVARGASQTLTVTGKLLSPAAKKIKVSISGSSGVEISPKDFVLTGNTSSDVTVTVPQDASNDKPFFRVNGQALDNNNNPVTSNVPSILFQWTVPAPTP